MILRFVFPTTVTIEFYVVNDEVKYVPSESGVTVNNLRKEPETLLESHLIVTNPELLVNAFVRVYQNVLKLHLGAPSTVDSVQLAKVRPRGTKHRF